MGSRGSRGGLSPDASSVLRVVAGSGSKTTKAGPRRAAIARSCTNSWKTCFGSRAGYRGCSFEALHIRPTWRSPRRDLHPFSIDRGLMADNGPYRQTVPIIRASFLVLLWAPVGTGETGKGVVGRVGQCVGRGTSGEEAELVVAKSESTLLGTPYGLRGGC